MNVDNKNIHGPFDKRSKMTKLKSSLMATIKENQCPLEYKTLLGSIRYTTFYW